jgi:hypothetical protein
MMSVMMEKDDLDAESLIKRRVVILRRVLEELRVDSKIMKGNFAGSSRLEVQHFHTGGSSESRSWGFKADEPQIVLLDRSHITVSTQKA